MPIGTTEQRQEQRRLKQVDYQAKYRAESKRQEGKWEFEQFLKAQRTWVQRRLQLGFGRIADARYTAEEGDEMTLVKFQR